MHPCWLLPMRTLALAVSAALVPIPCAVASPSPEAPKSGYLMIAGGALEKPERSKVFARLAEMAGTTGTVAVLPTASGVPEESGNGMVEDFDGLIGKGRSVVVWLTTSTATQAESTTVAKTLASSSILWFTGGDQSRITAVFRPGGGRTAAYDATMEVLREGGVIAGSSAGAAMQSNPMISWGSSDDALMNGQSRKEDRGVGISVGMGYFPFGITDQHFLRRGRLGRLVTAQFITGTRFGWGVDEKRGMLVDLKNGSVEAVGEQSFLLSDIDGATSVPGKITGIHLALLNHGDRADAHTGKITPAPNAKPIKPGSGETMAKTVPTNPWDDFSISIAMRHVLASNEPVVMRSRQHEVTLRPGKNLRGWHGGTEDIAVGVDGILLDIRRLTDQEQAAATPTPQRPRR